MRIMRWQCRCLTISLVLCVAESFLLPSSSFQGLSARASTFVEAKAVRTSISNRLISVQNRPFSLVAKSTNSQPSVFPGTMGGILEKIRTNIARQTRWIVAGGSAIGVLWRQDAIAYRAVSNGILSKVLKQLLKQDRPEGAPVSDPGMPSSHAMTLFFLASYLCAATTVWTAYQPAFKILISLALSYFAVNSVVWRVAARYHTRDQVTVGAVLGTLHGIAWFALTAAHPAELARLDAAVRGRPLLAAGVGVAAVCWPSFLGWVEDSYIAFAAAARQRKEGEAG